MLDKSFDFHKAQDEFTPKWEKSGLTHADPSSDKQPFTIMMPPPNVTGSLHVGHALVMTLQDVLCRYHRMKGKDVLWMPGTDHASIAVDVLVSKQLEAEGTSKKEVGREEFLRRCWQQKEESGGTIMQQLRKLGATPDWSRERFTMDDAYMKSVITIFVKMYKDGLIYRDQRLVNWDPKMQTSISDIEVDHKDVKGKLYHVKYPYEDGSGFISVATTRPETILADGAVAVHPDDEKYKDVVGKFVVVPVANRIIPIIADEYVKSDFGSGAVKITAAHDYNDFEVYKRNKDKGIPLINLINPDGTMNENCPEDYIGLDRFAAREKLIADLDELEYLEKIEDHVHQVPYAERSGVVVEPYLTDQWYVDAQKIGQPALEAVENDVTQFVPKQWENTYFSWMRDLEPWCISRQLWWGYQIPAWYGPDGKIFVEETEAEAYEAATKHYGEAVELTQDEDILDTWFSSGLWPFATLGWPEKTPELAKYYPGDVLVTGFDIIFFWVARMMMMGMYAMDGQVPFPTVYMHGLVRDLKGTENVQIQGQCFVLKARKRAMDSDVVVVNHHLFLADLAIKETGFGELIPEADVFIFDEAHQLPDIASEYFGQTVSSRQIHDLAKDIEIAYRTEAKDMRQLQKVGDKLLQSAMDMRIVLGEPGYRGNWREALQSESIKRELVRLTDSLELAIDVLKLALGRSQLLDVAFERANLIKGRIDRVCDVDITGYSYWYDTSPRHFALHITPLSVADKFHEQIEIKQGAWIFTSATLAVSGDFKHFTDRLGLKPKQQFSLPSPFDYEKQARLCVPRYLPEPNSPGLADKLVSMLAPVIEENQGRCFFLCTSHSMMRELGEKFRAVLDLPVLMQGEMSKQKTLAEFMELGNALLVATGAFWEGIDVRGDALSCVIIDKLPFTAPDDPLLKARIEDCRLRGGEPFAEVQIPDAVITLKQGVGRLIRDQKDHGALIICDNRLVTRDYGGIFLGSLPPIPRTRDLERIKAFLKEEKLVTGVRCGITK